MKRMMIVAGCMMGLVALSMAQEKPADNAKGRMERHPGMGMGPMDGEMPMMQITKDLGLSKEQMQQMKSVFAGSADELKSLTSKMQDAAKAQAELMGQDSPNEEAVMKGVDEIAKLRAEIGRIRMKQMLAVHKILTPEQRAKMREKMKAQMEKRNAMGGRGKHKGEGFRKGSDAGGEGHEAPAAKAE